MIKKILFLAMVASMALSMACDEYLVSELNSEEQLSMIYRHGELRAAEKLKDGSIDEYGEYFVIGNVTGIFQQEGEALIVSFFGSDDVLDWIANLHFLMVKAPFENADSADKIHLGFLYSYNEVRDHVMERIERFLADGNRRIVIAGHSLGAAIATLLAYELALTRDDIFLSCFASGSPRVGNEEFAENFYSAVPACYRYVNRDDIVPQIPTEDMGYRHTCEYHHIGEEANPARQTLLLGIQDHFVEKYVESLDRGLY